MALVVAFRFDASARIGLGHMRRCMSLARALIECGAEVHLLTRDLGLDASSEARRAGATLHVLPAPSDTVPYYSEPQYGEPTHARWIGITGPQDANDTLAALAAETLSPDWIVVDHYALDERWHQQVATVTGAALAVIDDLADRSLFAQILIDHNYCGDHAAKYAGRLVADTRMACGPRYALLGAAYGGAPVFKVRATVGSIGIFMGGTDPSNLSCIVLAACRLHAGFAGTIEIVSTKANPQLQTLQAAVAASPGTVLTLDLPDLCDFFKRHDLQIGCGGGASWERCCVGAPSLVLVGAANQRAVVPELAAIGAIATLPEEFSKDAAFIGQALSVLLRDRERRQALSQRAHELVDGRGAQRVALLMSADELRLRPADVQDAEMLHAWRDHLSTRSMARDPAPIAFDTHVQWLARTLADPLRCIWVGYIGSVNIGAIRFDADGDGDAEVSLYLDPDLHGLGLGARLLAAGESAASSAGLARRHFLATVLKGNPASRRLFDSAGYSQVSTSAHDGDISTEYRLVKSVPSRTSLYKVDTA